MNKRKLHHTHKQLRFVNAWYFAVAAIIFLIIGINALRDNYRTMVDLRQAVTRADQQGTDVQKPLNKLRTHVYAHMNTNLSSGNVPIKPPIQLKHTYERLVAAEKERVKQATPAIAAQAEATCLAQFPASGPNVARITCVQDYMSANAAREQAIPSELYKFDFKSPTWSPDQAGISLVLAGVFLVLFVLRYATERWLIARIK